MIFYDFIQHSFGRPSLCCCNASVCQGQSALIDALFKTIDLTQRIWFEVVKFGKPVFQTSFNSVTTGCAGFKDLRFWKFVENQKDEWMQGNWSRPQYI